MEENKQSQKLFYNFRHQLVKYNAKQKVIMIFELQKTQNYQN